MLFCKDFLFIHVPKTGGMSVTRWLLNNYMGEMFLSIPARGVDHSDTSYEFPDIKDRVKIIEGKRHETLAEARDQVGKMGFALKDFKTIVGVVRHPFELERSYHAHLKKPRVAGRRSSAELNHSDVQMAQRYDLADFIRHGCYYGQYPARIEEYFEIDGVAPDNLEIVRMEQFQSDLERVFGPFLSGRHPLEHRNKSKSLLRAPPPAPSPDLDAPLARKHPFLARLYGLPVPPRETPKSIARMEPARLAAMLGTELPAEAKEDLVKIAKLIEKATDQGPVNLVEVSDALRRIFAEINKTLETEDKVIIPGLGRFIKRKRADGAMGYVFKPMSAKKPE